VSPSGTHWQLAHSRLVVGRPTLKCTLKRTGLLLYAILVAGVPDANARAAISLTPADCLCQVALRPPSGAQCANGRSLARQREEPEPAIGTAITGLEGWADATAVCELHWDLPDLRVILPLSTAALPLNAEVGYFAPAVCHKSAKSQLLVGRGRAYRMHCRQFPHTLLIASGRFALGRHAANLQPLRRWAGQKSVCWLNASCVVRPPAETFRSRAWRALRMTLGGSWHQPLQTGYGIVECIHAHPFIPSIHASGAKPES